ncbi:MAG: Holliday junction resolvase [Cyanobium sp. CACIAM 14]|nr:MAG: Holliday junction resolvase [Cyanobium sp. CACIAM 14]
MSPRPRSVLALDVGRRRIGLAGCDPLGFTVSPLPALSRGTFGSDLERIQALARQRRVQALVVGLPLDAAQRPTAQAVHCRRYGLRLARALGDGGLGLPLAWVDEHASSWEAGERFALHGDRSGRLDSAVAALLLEQWLREGPEPVPPGASATDPVDPATIAVGAAAPADPF